MEVVSIFLHDYLQFLILWSQGRPSLGWLRLEVASFFTSRKAVYVGNNGSEDDGN